MTDLFIVGGGPAGLAAAIAARRLGLKVVVADSRCPPIDKACGEGLLPDTLAAAAAIGLALPARCYRFQGVRFRGEGVSVESRFNQSHGAGVRRTELHQCLVDQAGSLGVEFRWGTCIRSLGEIDARWIVGADGANSQVRRWAGLTRTWTDSHRFGYRQHFARSPWTDFLEIYWGNGFQLYITPVSGDEVSVAVLSHDKTLRVAEALSRFPELAARFAGISHSGQERGALTASRKLRRVTHANVALLGDASGSVDAISGEGLGLAFRQASALASALEREDLKSYSRAHARIEFRPRFMAGFMLSIDRWHWLRREVLPSMARRPDVFNRLIAMHLGEANWGEFACACARLGWQIARP